MSPLSPVPLNHVSHIDTSNISPRCQATTHLILCKLVSLWHEVISYPAGEERERRITVSSLWLWINCDLHSTRYALSARWDFVNDVHSVTRYKLIHSVRAAEPFLRCLCRFERKISHTHTHTPPPQRSSVPSGSELEGVVCIVSSGSDPDKTQVKLRGATAHLCRHDADCTLTVSHDTLCVWLFFNIFDAVDVFMQQFPQSEASYFKFWTELSMSKWSLKTITLNKTKRKYFISRYSSQSQVTVMGECKNPNIRHYESMIIIHFWINMTFWEMRMKFKSSMCPSSTGEKQTSQLKLWNSIVLFYKHVGQYPEVAPGHSFIISLS